MSITTANFKLVPLYPIKWRPFKIFVKLQKSPLLIANIVKGAVSDLRQFLESENPGKMMKNPFYEMILILMAIILVKYSL